MKLFRPSGGALYHWRAFREGAGWRDFRESLAAWLEGWAAPVDQPLLLIGPSAGYTLPAAWLARFREVAAFDLDPLAPWFFRHGRTPFSRQDLFFVDGKLSLEPLRKVLAQHPRSSLLFCNVLGQLPLEHPIPEERWPKYLIELRGILNGRTWASYHDLYTIEPLARGLHEQVTREFASRRDVGAAVKKSVENAESEIIDHDMCGAWTKDLPRSFFGWSLTARSLHLIEGVYAQTRLAAAQKQNFGINPLRPSWSGNETQFTPVWAWLRADPARFVPNTRDLPSGFSKI